MTNKIDTIIFDVDGTLLDTSEGVLDSVKYTIQKFGFNMLDDKELSTFIGPPIQNSFASHYGLKGPVIQDIAIVFRNRYKDYDLLKAKAYDGIYILFDELVKHNIKIGIATYKRQDYATKIMQHFGFDKYTNVILGADNENKLKKQDIIELAMQKLGSSVNSSVMVGDSDNDAIGAHALGMGFIAVTYGFGFKSKCDADKYENIGVAKSTTELKNIILGAENEN